MTNPALPGQLIEGSGSGAVHKSLFGGEPVPFKVNSSTAVLESGRVTEHYLSFPWSGAEHYAADYSRRFILAQGLSIVQIGSEGSG